MTISRFDVIYRRALLSQFFTKGWGSYETYMQLLKFREIMVDRQKCYNYVSKTYPIHIIHEQVHPDYYEINGKFLTPLLLHTPELIHPETREAFFQLLVPLKWKDELYRPVCLHIAGTGDHYFWRRRYYMAKPLLHYGIGAIILENPYYGLRKPLGQIRSNLHYVSDIFVMGACLILECVVLLNWCERLGFGPLGITGVSMGGHMASLVASIWPRPLVLVPCLSWTTASSAFTEGVLAESINWDLLQKELLSNEVFYKNLSKSCKIVDCPFQSNLFSLFDIDPNIHTSDKSKQFVTPYEINNLLARELYHNLQKKRLMSRRRKKRKEKNSIHLSRRRQRSHEALWFMRGMMDEFTHLKNFPAPYDIDLVIAVCAKSDAYIPRDGVSNFEDIWPGITIKYIDTGHIGACLWYKKLFRKSILEAFEKAKAKIELTL